MDLYDITGTQISQWGTRPQLTGRGYCALDLMDVLATPQDGPFVITDAAGNTVTDRQVIAAAHAEATTAQAHVHWTKCMADLVMAQLLPTALSRVPTEADWTRAGQWWAHNVTTPPEPALLVEVQRQLLLGDPRQHPDGVQFFVAAAAPPAMPRFQGDLGLSVLDAPPRPPSRVRGSLATGAAPPGTRPTAGGATAGHGSPYTDLPGRGRH